MFVIHSMLNTSIHSLESRADGKLRRQEMNFKDVYKSTWKVINCIVETKRKTLFTDRKEKKLKHFLSWIRFYIKQ